MPKTLLLADDSVVIQKLVGLSFANEDIELITVDNGDDAIARALEARPDLVLADVVMPGKNGYEVCQAIKQAPELAGTPVLLLTGTFEAFDQDRARAAGSDGHITKPFEARALVDCVNSMLAKASPGAAKPAASEPSVAAGPESYDAFDFFDEETESSAEAVMVPDTLTDFTVAPTELLEAPGPAPTAVADDLFGTSTIEASEFASEPPALLTFEEIGDSPQGDDAAMTVLAPDLLIDPDTAAISTEEPPDLAELEPLDVGLPTEDVALFGEAPSPDDTPVDANESSDWTDSNLDIGIGTGETFPGGALANPPSLEALDALEPGSPPEGPAAPERDPVDDSQFDISSSDLGDLIGNAPVAPPPSQALPQVPASSPSAPEAGTDLSPAARQQIHDVIEKVAWEAFSDLSETLVKQVVERVERIAWEVVPQMAEALIQEEIRRMKGDS